MRRLQARAPVAAALAVAATALAGCAAPGGPSAQDAPAGGVPREHRGAFDVDVQNCFAGLVLTTGMTVDDDAWYEVPASTRFADVVADYSQRLGDGWTTGLDGVQGSKCHLQTWTKGRLVGQDAVFAVAVLDDAVEPTDGRPFRFVVVARQG